ncbi:MAG: ABC transporter permease [Clostridiales Family XIII bacterium]|jgi:ABC-2 type transport system permease protein|nr:ABC transporter permease [Clostridiales Family XIII bacterium]
MFEFILRGVRELFRDSSGVFFSFIFPIVLVLILGSMLSSLDNPGGDRPVGSIRIEVCREEGAEDAPAVDALLDGLGGSGGIEVHESGFDVATARVDSGDADCVLRFASPLRASVYEGSDAIKNRAVTMIAQGFAREYAALSAIARTNPQQLAVIMQGRADAATGTANGLTADRDFGVTRSMLDYYAVTIVVMIAFMGSGIGGAVDVYSMRREGTLRRVGASPRAKTRIYLETVLSLLPQNILSPALIMLFSTLAFGAKYTATWQGDLLLFAFFVLLGLAFTSVCMLLGMVLRVNPMMPLMGVLWILLFLSGTFYKDISIPGISEYLPMHIAQQAAFDLTLFGKAGKLLVVMAVCACVVAAASAVGARFVKRKEVLL